MLFGMPTLIEIDSLDDTMELCRELGFRFIELNMNLPQYQAKALENTEYLLRLQEKYRIGYTIHLDENLNICDFNQAVALAYTDTVRRTIRAAKVIKAPVLNMHMNHGVYFTLPDRKVQLFEKYHSIYMETWRRFRSMCEEEIGDAGIRICIENTDGYQSYEKDAISYLLESKVFALTWDIGHSHCAGGIDEEFIVSRADRLAHFHIHDAKGKSCHLTLGAGEIDLAGRLQTAREHLCRCVVETKTVEALRRSAAWLRENGFCSDSRSL